jgi:uncharacterized protein
LFSKVGKMFAPLMWWTAESRLAAVEAELAKGWSYAAYDTLRRMAGEGSAPAQYRLAQMFERAEGVIQNLADAVYWYRMAAEQGHTPSQARLGLIFFVDPPAPASLTPDAFERVRSGEVPTGTMLGKSFPHGFSVTKDFSEAAKWNRLAGEGGAADAQARYGHQLALGLGVDRDVDQAARWLGAAAAQGDTGGQVGLGVLYAGGYGTPPDYPSALEWLEKASAAGNPAAQCWLAILLLRGQGTPQNAGLAIGLLERAVDQDHLEAMYLLGLTMWRGEYVAADNSAAETLLRRAAGRGHVEAASVLARVLLDQEAGNDVEAAGWLRNAAEAGHKGAAAALAELYLAGRGVEANAVEAARWLEIGETESRAEAFTALASFYAEGVGVEQNFDVAADWLQHAAERGSVTAQYNMGWLYRLGKGVPQDLGKAARWYRQAAELDNAEAAFCLGLLYAEDDSPIADCAEAAQWFLRASEAGHGSASYNLAFLLIQGKGIERDPPRGLELLEELANGGSAAAAEALFHVHSNGEYSTPAPDLAAKFLVRAVELGSPSAANVLADWHLRGEAMPFDGEQTVEQLEIAARGGDVESQVALARLLYAGVTGASQLEAAHGWFAQAADAGHMFAQAWMGDCCRLGLVADPDPKAAEAWYRKAAAQNHLGAIVLLANAIEAAVPGRPDAVAEIFGLWLLAASAGHSIAQRKVAQCYLEGRGCPGDPDAAARWFRIAADQGDAEAQNQLAQSAQKQTPLRSNSATVPCAVVSCAPEQLYTTGGYYDPELSQDELLAMSSPYGTSIETIAEIFPGESVFRNPPHFIGGLPAAEQSELEEFFAAIDNANQTLAPSLLVNIRDAAVWNNMLFVLCDGKYLPVYESYRFIERHLKVPDISEQVSRVERKFRRRARTDQCFLFVGSAGSFNYGHWLIDDFPAYAALETLDSFGEAPTVVMSKAYPQMNTVRRDGVEAVRASRPERYPVAFVDPEAVYLFDEIYYVTPVSYHPTLKSRAAIAYTKAVCEERFASKVLPRKSAKRTGRNPSPCEGIFVNRSEGATRQLVNLDEIRMVLSEFGFKEIYPENLSFREQWQALRYARCVVGIMGAAMTNTLFSSQLTCLIYLAPAGWTEPFFWDLADANGQRYEVIFGPAVNEGGPVHESSFSIDPEQLRERIVGALEEAVA